jgi:hypothetical protein
MDLSAPGAATGNATKYEGEAFGGMDEATRASAQAALESILGAIERIRTAMRAIMSTVKVAIKPTDATPEWSDLMFILQNTVGRMERGWRELGAHPDPQETKAYQVAKAVGWDLQQHISVISGKEAPLQGELARFGDLMMSRKAWPQEILFERSFRGQCATYTETLDKVATAARGKDTYSIHAMYTTRTPKPGDSDFVYAGFSAHYEWKKESLYYQTQINFGKILDFLRKKIEDGVIAPRMGAVYVAHLIYCYYEIILATKAYATGLNLYLEQAMKVKQEDRKKKRIDLEPFFDFIDGAIAPGSPYSWAGVITRARDEAFYVCRDHHEQAERTSAADILGGVNASELAKDPGQISALIERVTGIRGLDLNSLKNIPGFGGLFESISGFLPGTRTA